MEMIFAFCLLLACMAVVKFFPGSKLAGFLASIAADEDKFQADRKPVKRNRKVINLNKAA